MVEAGEKGEEDGEDEEDMTEQQAMRMNEDVKQISPLLQLNLQITSRTRTYSINSYRYLAVVTASFDHEIHSLHSLSM